MRVLGDHEKIRRAVNILKWRIGLPADRSGIVVEKGVVTLTGDVEWRLQRRDKAWLHSAEVDASRISIETSIDKVILRGKIHAWYERNLAEQAAWAAPGVEDHIQIEP